MKPNRQEIARQLAALDPSVRAVLIYGPDEGLARERAARIAQQVVSDEKDAFRVARPAMTDILAEPARLTDELTALSLTGGRRLVRLDSADDRIAPAVDQALSASTGDTLLLVTSGELGPRSKLRRSFEGAPDQLAIPCYQEEGAALEAIARERCREIGLSLTDDALRALCDLAGANRAILESEFEKLLLYVGDSGEAIDLPQLSALCASTGELELRDIAAATTAGDIPKLDGLFERARSEGQAGIAVLRVVAGRFRQLHLLRGLMDGGTSFDAAAKMLRPPLFFKEIPAFRQDVGRWPVTKIASALRLTLEAEQQCKSDIGVPDAIAAHTCLRLAASVTSRRQSGQVN